MHLRPPPSVDPATLQAVNLKAKQILASGQRPEWLFVCQVPPGLLLFQNGQQRVMLLFTSSFAANDYLRATSTVGAVGQFRVESLPSLAKSWISQGVELAALDRCPRCPQFLTHSVSQFAKLTLEDFNTKVWATHRATRIIAGQSRMRSAMKHISEGAHAAARAELEYVRDHFDCGVPYLHQWIGLLAGMQQDLAAKASAAERLKEFGPQFDANLDFTPALMSTAMVGTMANFGLIPTGNPSR
ncbi:MAG TPA: hypothetical protein VGG72_07490 [Bryobacteraceae bacterium]|jgi:hypothetical protein